MTTERILELAKDFPVLTFEGTELYRKRSIANYQQALERFYKQAHADGQRAMRERAVKVCNTWIYSGDVRVEIQSLEIE